MLMLRCLAPLALVALVLPAKVARAEVAWLHDIQGWFGLEMFEDMACAGNPVRMRVAEGTDRLELRWRKPVTYADGSVTDAVDFRITGIQGGDVTMIRLRDGVPALFRFSGDFQSFDYFEGPDLEAAQKAEILVTFTRCELQGS